jgi:hypothetical protein
LPEHKLVIWRSGQVASTARATMVTSRRLLRCRQWLRLSAADAALVLPVLPAECNHYADCSCPLRCVRDAVAGAR